MNPNPNTGLRLVLTLLPVVIGMPITTYAADSGAHILKKAREPLTDTEYWAYMVTSILLVVVGGVFSGLTLGLMGQDEVHLQVISQSGTSKERKNAKTVLKLLSKGKHWLLVTLLLSNVVTNETLPVILDRFLGGGAIAVFGSTVLIVIFGEIIPQSVCVRYGLQIGAFFAPYVQLLMYLLYPVAYPVAKLLDYSLGEEHGTLYGHSGLKTFVNLHHTMGVERLNQDEVTIINAVLDLKGKAVGEVMTPMEKVYTLPSDTILDEDTVEEIFNGGFSRIPIHLPGEPTNFVGMLLVRILISYDPEDALPVSAFPLATLPETGYYTSCLNILNYFQEGKSHMVIVSETPGMDSGAKGLVTLEDVIEELIGEEIVDESDVYVDVDRDIKRSIPGPLAKRNVVHYLHDLYNSGHEDSDENSSLIASKSVASKSVLGVASTASVGGASSPPASYIRKDEFKEAQERKRAERHAEGQPPALGLDHPAPVDDEARANSSIHTKMKPSNLAADPLHTTNEHITIKKQPRLDPTQATHRVVSGPKKYTKKVTAIDAMTSPILAGQNKKNSYGSGDESVKSGSPKQFEPVVGGLYNSEVGAFVKGVQDNLKRSNSRGNHVSSANNEAAENILSEDLEAMRVDKQQPRASKPASTTPAQDTSSTARAKTKLSADKKRLEDKVLPKSPFAEDRAISIDPVYSSGHSVASGATGSSVGIIENSIVTDSGFTKTVIQDYPTDGDDSSDPTGKRWNIRGRHH